MTETKGPKAPRQASQNRGLIPGVKPKTRDGEPLAPSVFDGDSNRALSLLQKRARADFVFRLNLYAKVADGDLEQKVRTIAPDGKETVTIYTPSVKDRMAAMDKLASYGRVPTGEKGQGGGGTDLPTLIRALSAVMADPVTRRNLMQDERIRGTLSLLGAQEVELVDDGTASHVPGDSAESPDETGT